MKKGRKEGREGRREETHEEWTKTEKDRERYKKPIWITYLMFNSVSNVVSGSLRTDDFSKCMSSLYV
jgi:hypothetical protein